MNTFWQTHRTSVIAVAIAVIALLSTVIVVPETQEAVIIRGGDPVAVVNKFKPDRPYGQTGAGIGTAFRSSTASNTSTSACLMSTWSRRRYCRPTSCG